MVVVLRIDSHIDIEGRAGDNVNAQAVLNILLHQLLGRVSHKKSAIYFSIEDGFLTGFFASSHNDFRSRPDI